MARTLLPFGLALLDQVYHMIVHPGTCIASSPELHLCPAGRGPATETYFDIGIKVQASLHHYPTPTTTRYSWPFQFIAFAQRCWNMLPGRDIINVQCRGGGYHCG
jgi:hypothetical protein